LALIPSAPRDAWLTGVRDLRVHMRNVPEALRKAIAHLLLRRIHLGETGSGILARASNLTYQSRKRTQKKAPGGCAIQGLIRQAAAAKSYDAVAGSGLCNPTTNITAAPLAQ